MIFPKFWRLILKNFGDSLEVVGDHSDQLYRLAIIPTAYSVGLHLPVCRIVASAVKLSIAERSKPCRASCGTLQKF